MIQRADELSEFVAIYWAGGRQPLSAQVKKGLAAAFCKFDEYALAKYDRAGAVRLRDVLFLSHARPVDEAQASLWKRLAENELATPDTWEVALSATGRGRMIAEACRYGSVCSLSGSSVHWRCCATCAISAGSGQNEELVLEALAAMKTDRVLPFRFLAAARVLRSGSRRWRRDVSRSRGPCGSLPGHTVLLVDVSGSMEAAISHRSDMRRTDAAYGLAILLREIAEKVTVYTFSNEAKLVAARREWRCAMRWTRASCTAERTWERRLRRWKPTCGRDTTAWW